MTKISLALSIPAWFGMAIGAAADGHIPRFWYLWTFAGIVLAIVTTVYIVNHRRSQ